MNAFPSRSCLVLLLAAIAAPASATDLADGKLSLNGNGEWAYARTSENAYLLADGDGDYANAMFDVVLTARPDDRIVIAADLGFDREEVGLEWGFAEWRFSDAARLRLGKVKQPLGNYMELQFVGTARPFFTLPTSVYGPANIGGTAYWGAGLTGERTAESGFGLAYDLYGGALELPTHEPYQELVGAEAVDGAVLAENLAGARLSLLTPWDVTFRLSAFGGRSQLEGEDVGGGEAERNDFLVYGASALYRGEKLWLSVEAFQSRQFGDETQLGAYAEAAYFVTRRWQLAARYELARVTIEDLDSDSSLLRHDEAALGVNFWISPHVVFKTSVHAVDGRRFAEPGEGELSATGRTTLVVAGAQFTF